MAQRISQGEADDQGVRRRRSACRPRRGAAGGRAVRPARALPDLQRGLREQRRRRAPARRPVRRGDPAREDGPRRAARRPRGRRPPGADAADRRAAPGPDRRATATRSRSPTRTGRCWDRERIAEGTALLDAAIAEGAVGEYQLQAAIAAIHDRAPRGRRHGLAADPRAVRAAGADDRQPGRDAQPGGRGGAWPTGPAAGLAILDGMDGALAGQPPGRGRARPPARDGGRHRWRARALPGGGAADARTSPSSATWRRGLRDSGRVAPDARPLRCGPTVAGAGVAPGAVDDRGTAMDATRPLAVDTTDDAALDDGIAIYERLMPRDRALSGHRAGRCVPRLPGRDGAIRLVGPPRRRCRPGRDARRARDRDRGGLARGGARLLRVHHHRKRRQAPRRLTRQSAQRVASATACTRSMRSSARASAGWPSYAVFRPIPGRLRQRRLDRPTSSRSGPRARRRSNAWA